MTMEVTLNIIMLARDARSFYDSYEVLRNTNTGLSVRQSNEIKRRHTQSKDLHRPIPAINDQMELSTPSLVCLAFSTELHIKLLLCIYDIAGRGHDIDKLIRKLPKEEIERISIHSEFHPTQQGESFFWNIAIAAKLFVRTRYYFETLETLHFNSSFCVTLCKVIRERVAERVPYLKHDLGH